MACVHCKRIDCNGEHGSISDGYHTFDELYEHRITLWIALCRRVRNSVRESLNPVWRSKLHSDGTAFDGWFVLGMFHQPGHQITYHLPLSRWDETDFAVTKAKAPEFDGHTSADAIARIAAL